MKRILLCLMMYGSCTHAMMIRQFLVDFERLQTMGRLKQWEIVTALFHRWGRNDNDAEELPLLFPVLMPLQQVAQQEGPENEQHEQERKEHERAQKLEARENAKRAWHASKHHNNYLSKKDKWVCQQPRSKKNNR